MTERRELTMTLTEGVVLDVLAAAKIGTKHIPASIRRKYEDSIDAVLDEAKTAEQGYPRLTEVPLD